MPRVRRRYGRKYYKKKKPFRVPIVILSIILVLECAYATAVYSSIPFIEKWRTIYIETAMSTLSHQWLATWFIPQSIIDKVMDAVRADVEAQVELNSAWEIEEPEETETPEPTVPVEVSEKPEVTVEEDPEEDAFYETYWELDTDSVRAYFEEHPDALSDGYDSIYVDNMDGRLELYTVNGDPVRILDTENNLLILKVSGDGYQGKLAIVKDPRQLKLVKAKNLGGYGDQLYTFGERYDAILAMNASGFIDAEGHGNGGTVVGALIIDGVEYGRPEYGSTYKFFGFQTDYRMYITNYSKITRSDYLWGIQFFPALVVDGKSVVDGTYGMGIQPRAVFGQTKNGDVLMMVIDGRQVGYSLGCTVADCTDILMDYHAYQAMNLDGGSTAIMWYNGENITSTSSPNEDGRYLPDAFVVLPASEVD